MIRTRWMLLAAVLVVAACEDTPKDNPMAPSTSVVGGPVLPPPPPPPGVVKLTGTLSIQGNIVRLATATKVVVLVDLALTTAQELEDCDVVVLGYWHGDVFSVAAIEEDLPAPDSLR